MGLSGRAHIRGRGITAGRRRRRASWARARLVSCKDRIFAGGGIGPDTQRRTGDRPPAHGNSTLTLG
ncbi:hypothetical protein GCM10027072_48480 [Streptomyces bullii]